MKLMMTVLAMTFALGVSAAEIKLATAISDTTTEKTVFYLETNTDGSVQAMRYVTTTESGQITEDVHSTLPEIYNGGVVVKVMEGREIVRLFLEKFNAEKGGDVRLQFLANGVTGSHSNQIIKLAKKDGVFALIDDAGKVANSLFLKGNWSRILRRWIGVSEIQVTFEAKNK